MVADNNYYYTDPLLNYCTYYYYHLLTLAFYSIVLYYMGKGVPLHFIGGGGQEKKIDHSNINCTFGLDVRKNYYRSAAVLILKACKSTQCNTLCSDQVLSRVHVHVYKSWLMTSRRVVIA